MVARNACPRKRRGRKSATHATRRRRQALETTTEDQVECSRDDAFCLARQAGPGPRI
jgi:hypothetical protein